MGLDATAMALLPRITQAARYGDDALMRVIIDSFESQGLPAVGADQAMSSLVPEAGVLGAVVPDEIARTIRGGRIVVMEQNGADLPPSNRSVWSVRIGYERHDKMTRKSHEPEKTPLCSRSTSRSSSCDVPMLVSRH